MRALVTGGPGFAGSHLTEYLLGLNWDVTVLAAEGEDLGNLTRCLSRIRVLRADLRNGAAVRAAVQASAPDRVYHLAALSSPADSLRQPALTYEINFLGTLNLLLACREAAEQACILFVSSSEVYGTVSADEMPVREATPFRPTNPYAASKAAAELLAFQFFQSYGTHVVRTRPFNHTGPRQSPAFVCSDFARQVAEVELGLSPPRVTVGNLSVRRDFSDVRDIVRGYHLLLEKGLPGEVYQLGSGRAVEIGEILQLLLTDCSTKVEVVVDPERFRRSESVAVWGNTTKAEKAVGWTREFTLETTLHDLKEFWKNQLLRVSQPSRVP